MGVIDLELAEALLGPTPGAGTYRHRLQGARRDGVDLVRYNRYLADCDCWHYLGAVRPAA